MKKGFKRFLSATLATVMAVAGMTIGMATSAMAANGDFTLGAEVFYEAATTGSVDPDHNPVEVTGLYKAEVTSSTKKFTPGTIGDFATLKKKTLTNTTSFTNEMLAGGSRQITVTPAYPGTATVYVYHDGTKILKLNGQETTPAAQKWTVTGYDVSCGAGESFTIDLATNIAFVGLTYTAGEVTTYNWNLDLTGLTSVDGTGLSLGNATTTALSNTLSYTGTGFTLKDTYATITDATAGVTVDSANNTVTVKPTDDWFDVVAPRNYVSVEPSEDGNKVIYNFTQADDSEKYLVSVNDTTKSSTTAYTAFSVDGTSDNDCYVTLDTTGAKLCDDSTTAAVKLMVPYSASTGKVTVSGRVTPTNNIGGKWKLVDLGCVSVATDSNKMVTLTNNNQVASTDNVGVAVKNQPIDYVVTIDFAAKTASGTITNGAAEKAFTNVPFEDGVTNMGAIAFTTNNGNSISSGNDRGLLIPSVTIIAEESTSPVVTTTDANSKPGVITVGDANYVVSVVSSEDAKTANSLVQKTAAGTEIASTDTVYKQIVLDGNTYTAKDINPNASENDYVFASIVNNDNATEQATVITNIQKLVSEVK